MEYILLIKTLNIDIMQKTDAEIKRQEKLFSIAVYGLFIILSTCVLIIILSLIV